MRLIPYATTTCQNLQGSINTVAHHSQNLFFLFILLMNVVDEVYSLSMQVAVLANKVAVKEEEKCQMISVSDVHRVFLEIKRK